ncbi:MAG TPA: hypothetical protein VFB52_10825, partial [Solirubrobacterales bacterium]|nr:hypothetical protein [Solirubrobacterales bacterium]
DRAMGPVNRDLVVANHRANVHVQDLLDVFERLGAPRSRPAAPLGEMARLVRLEWRARSEIHGLLAENAHLRELLDRQAEDCAAQVETYERSLSWRLTKPLRVLNALRRRLRRKR